MSNQTYVKLTGWVTKDPDLRVTNKDGTPVCTVRVGTASRWLDRSKGEWQEGPPSYFDVVCWRSLAVNAASSLRKGHRVTVHGTFRTRSWTDRDNKTRTEVEIIATSLGHDLLFGWTHFNRIRPATEGSAEAVAMGEASRGLPTGTGEEFGPSGNYGPERPEEGPFDGYDADPAARPAHGPDGGQDGAPGDEPGVGRVLGTGDDGGAENAGSSEAAAGDPRPTDVAVPF